MGEYMGINKKKKQAVSKTCICAATLETIEVGEHRVKETALSLELCAKCVYISLMNKP